MMVFDGPRTRCDARLVSDGRTDKTAGLRSSRIGRSGAVAEKNLDLKGLKCPLPALKTRKALSGLKADDILIVECTDPLSAIDIPNLLNETRDVLVTSARAETVLTFTIRKV